MSRSKVSSQSTTESRLVPATAAGQALGYSLQYTRLTALLLTAPEGSRCSLEVIEDIAVEEPNAGQLMLIQSKSALGANPISDRAISLWKTLFNWVQLVEQGFVQPEITIFEIYVSRPATGELAKAFSDAIKPAAS